MTLREIEQRVEQLNQGAGARHREEAAKLNLGDDATLEQMRDGLLALGPAETIVVEVKGFERGSLKI